MLEHEAFGYFSFILDFFLIYSSPLSLYGNMQEPDTEKE